MKMFTKATVFIAACLALVGFASPAAKNQSLAQVITHCVTPNTVALTFDDGPYVYLYNITSALAAANATGTFFFNGNNYECIYDPAEIKRVQYVFDSGHQVASHTWSHKDLTKLSPARINREMALVDQALQRIIGVVPAFMRPPFGSYNDRVRNIAFKRGQRLVLWDFDSGDSVGASPAQSKARYDKLIAKHPSNILPLNHEVIKTINEVLPYAINKLQAAGYNLVSLADCLGLLAYKSQSPRGTPDATWRC